MALQQLHWCSTNPIGCCLCRCGVLWLQSSTVSTCGFRPGRERYYTRKKHFESLVKQSTSQIKGFDSKSKPLWSTISLATAALCNEPNEVQSLRGNVTGDVTWSIFFTSFLFCFTVSDALPWEVGTLFNTLNTPQAGEGLGMRLESSCLYLVPSAGGMTRSSFFLTWCLLSGAMHRSFRGSSPQAIIKWLLSIVSSFPSSSTPSSLLSSLLPPPFLPPLSLLPPSSQTLHWWSNSSEWAYANPPELCPQSKHQHYLHLQGNTNHSSIQSIVRVMSQLNSQ